MPFERPVFETKFELTKKSNQDERLSRYLEKRKKAREIYDFTAKEKFLLADTYQLVEYLRKKDSRYAHLTIIQQSEDGSFQEKKFFKLLTSKGERRERDEEAFLREILVTDFLARKTDIPARKVDSYYINPNKKDFYAIMETLPKAQVGFIEKSDEITDLTEKHAQKCIENLVKIQDEIKKIPPEVREKLSEREVLNSYEGLLEDVEGIIKEEVHPLDKPEGELFHQTMNRRLGLVDFKNKAIELIEKFKKVIQEAESSRDYLVHGDLSPNNLYVHDNGKVEFLDWEWASISNNEVLATIYDYGNLRARAWNNQKFREALDQAIIDQYKDDPEKGKAIVSLGILRSHLMLAGFFEDYPQEKQMKENETARRENTEEDVRKAFEISNIRL